MPIIVLGYAVFKMFYIFYHSDKINSFLKIYRELGEEDTDKARTNIYWANIVLYSAFVCLFFLILTLHNLFIFFNFFFLLYFNL